MKKRLDMLSGSGVEETATVSAVPGPRELPPARVTQGKRLLSVAARLLAACVIILPTVLGARVGLLSVLAADGFSAFSYWGIFAIYLWTRPGRNECLVTITIGFLLCIASRQILALRGTYFGHTIICNGIYFGIASSIVLLCTVPQLSGKVRQRKLRALLASVVLINFRIYAVFSLHLASMLCPNKYDLWLYAIDRSFGQPSFLLGRLFAQSRVILNLETTIYYALPLAYAIVYASHANSRERWPVNIFRGMILSGLLVFPLYVAYPAAGPLYAFRGEFPYSLPPMPQLRTLALARPPNCMPSLHMAGALLVWWNARPWLWARVAGGVFALLTAFATLGTGEHYIIDLVVAVPYALAIQGASTEHQQRFAALLAGAGLTIGWIAVLRLGGSLLSNPLLIWALTLGTLGASLFLERKLSNAVFRRPAVESAA